MSAEAEPSRQADKPDLHWRGLSEVVFFVNDSLSAKDQACIKAILLIAGATESVAPAPAALKETAAANSQEQRRRLRTARFDPDTVTHIISDTFDFPEFEDIRERLEEGKVWICSPQWAPRSVLARQLQDPSRFSVDPVMIFSGVCVACLGDIPAQDQEIIIGAVTALGGQSRIAAVADVTHFITLGPDPVTFGTVVSAKTGMKFVLPHWIYECMKTRRLLPISNYEFTDAKTNPPILDAAMGEDAFRTTKEILSKQNQDLAGNPLGSVASKENASFFRTTVEQHIEHVETSQAAERRVGQVTSTVFDGRKVLLGKELEVDKAARIALNSWIRMASGEAMEEGSDISDCDIFITRWRDGRDFLHAVRDQKTVATLSWFYHVLVVNRLTSPKDNLLHYPVPRAAIPGFERMTISLTNYSGVSRDYLKKLIQATGAEFTTTLSNDNTHLVAANLEGLKVKRAFHWNLPVINHFWLEDCFKAWAVVPITQRHREYPKGVHYATLVRGVSLAEEDIAHWVNADPADVREFEDRQEDVEMGDVDNDLRVGGTGNLSDNASDKTMKEGKRASQAASAQTNGPRDSVSRGGKRKSAGLVHEVETEKPGAGHGRKRPRFDSPAGSERGRKTSGGLELDNVLTPGASRRSKALAADKVSHMAADMTEYQRTKGRKDLIDPKDREACRVPRDRREGDSSPDHRGRTEEMEDDPEREAKPLHAAGRSKQRKRVSDGQGEAATTTQRKLSSSGNRPRERSRSVPAKEQESMVRYLTTGLTLSQKEVLEMSKLGAKRVESPSECTHLVCSSLTRTPKFLQCIPMAPAIVDKDWITSSIQQKRIANAKHHLLKDAKGEAKYDFSLEISLMHARSFLRQGGLLAGHTFYVTNNLPTTFETLTDIVAAAGGKTQRYTPKADKKLRESAKAYAGDRIANTHHLISIDSDSHLWSDLVKKSGLVKVYDRELILTGVLKMRIDWDEDIIAGPGARVIQDGNVST